MKPAATDDRHFYTLTNSTGKCKCLAGEFHQEQADVRQASFWCHVFATANSATFSRSVCALWQFVSMQADNHLPFILLYHNVCHSPYAEFQAYPSSTSAPMLRQALSLSIIPTRYLLRAFPTNELSLRSLTTILMSERKPSNIGRQLNSLWAQQRRWKPPAAASRVEWNGRSIEWYWLQHGT